MTAHDRARQVRDAARDEIMSLPGVVGSGIGQDDQGQPCIRIYLLEDAPLTAYVRLIPHIEGVPTAWKVTGPIVASAHTEQRP